MRKSRTIQAGGRPKLAPEERRKTVGIQLNQARREKLDALAAAWGCKRSEVVDRLLDAASPDDPTP